MFEAATEKFFHDHPIPEQLQTRVREGLLVFRRRLDAVEAQARNEWSRVPVQVGDLLKRWFAQLRVVLDVPSRAQVDDLSQRLEGLQRQLQALELAQGSAQSPSATGKVTNNGAASARTSAATTTDAVVHAASRVAAADAVRTPTVTAVQAVASAPEAESAGAVAERPAATNGKRKRRAKR